MRRAAVGVTVCAALGRTAAGGGPEPEGAATGGSTGAVTAGPSARAALIRPPVTVRPARLGSGSTVPRILALTSTAERLGSAARSSAATPATTGAAYEVP